MEITVVAQKKLAEIAARFGARLMLLFGSAASNRLRPDSDLDIAVQLENPGPAYRDLYLIQQELQELFPGRDIDLALINRADPLFLSKIVQGCLLLHGATADLQQLRLYAFHRYQDYQPYFDLERRCVRRFLQETTATR
jgi:predicted nucleotidyltransferase